MLPSAVLFDLDDTLFDHHRSARAALAEVHRRHGGATDFDDFERHHIRFLEEMHIEVLAGRVELNEARRERFRRVFRALGVALPESEVDGVASAYRTGYMSARTAMEGAADLLTAVRTHARVGIVSNNLFEEQRDKLEYCGLSQLVDALVVSEEAGIAKPDPAIFHIALERLGVSALDAVMIGDSWSADVVGATRAGIRAIWFNPFRKPMPADPANIVEIYSLAPASDVLTVLAGGEHIRP
ncbi:MAG TPA: HAD-IA family hydrolase [Vicinamibacterales bacterium]|nr:HAD-IA family hydrolase [Vicinamibacterales bacterium]